MEIDLSNSDRAKISMPRKVWISETTISCSSTQVQTACAQNDGEL